MKNERISCWVGGEVRGRGEVERRGEEEGEVEGE
jgi:hypothetical protein